MAAERTFAFFAGLARTAMQAAREGRLVEVGRTAVGTTTVIRYVPRTAEDDAVAAMTRAAAQWLEARTRRDDTSEMEAELEAARVAFRRAERKRRRTERRMECSTLTG